MVTPRKLFDARIWTALMSLLGQLSIKEEPCVEKRIVMRIAHFKDSDIRNLGSFHFCDN